MSVYNVPCHYCGTPVDAFSRSTFRMIVGWERKAGTRASGKRGGSDVYLREPRDEYACTLCIERLKRGVSVAQESLL